MFGWPVPGYYTISSGYHDLRDYGLHGAIDIPAPVVPTMAIGAGRVASIDWVGDAGLSLYLDMDGWRAHYCHLNSTAVTVGQVVAAGDVVGQVGASTRGVLVYPNYPNHLHLNLFASERPATGPSHWVDWVGMWCVNPELYLEQEETMATAKEIENLLNGAVHHLMFGDNMLLAKMLELRDSGNADLERRLLAAIGDGAGVNYSRMRRIIRQEIDKTGLGEE